jgi:ubiquinone/menaquinone biosynthesis C-methylase UbiE
MIEFPSLPNGDKPRWVGAGFEVGGRVAGVLEYSFDVSGWDDELTAMQEAEAGDGTHPIDMLSRRTALTLLKESGFPEDGVLLEVGCSSGFLIRELRREYPKATLVGADVVSASLGKLAKANPTVAFVRMNMVQCVFPEHSFDGVVALNVLEHIEDDGHAVQEIYRVLKPGGVFVVEVPQGPGLFDGYDRALHHFRRYNRLSLRKLLSKVGFRLEYESHLAFVVYPVFALTKLIGRLRRQRGDDDLRRAERQIRSSRSSSLLTGALRVDSFLERFIRLPIGIRCVATGRKSRQAH